MTDARWLEILVRMVAGETSEEPTEGVLAVRLDEESDELTRLSVRKHGHRWRAEDEDGRLWSIQDDRHGYVFDPETDADGPPQRVGRGMSRMHGPVGEALSRPRPIDWVIGGDMRYDDATELAAPPRRTTFLGQDVWEVRLVLPGSRREMRFMVDVVDGRTLSSEHEDLGILFRWEEVAVVDPHRPELFAWDGPFESGFVTFGEDDDLPEQLAEVDDRWRWSVGAVGVSPGATERLVAELQARTRALSTTPDP